MYLNVPHLETAKKTLSAKLVPLYTLIFQLKAVQEKKNLSELECLQRKTNKKPQPNQLISAIKTGNKQKIIWKGEAVIFSVNNPYSSIVLFS